MVRTQIQLTERQVAVLKEIAAVEQRSMAEIIRLSVDFFVRARYSGEQEQIRKKALSAAGKFRSGRKDLATAHDASLSKAFCLCRHISHKKLPLSSPDKICKSEGRPPFLLLHRNFNLLPTILIMKQ